MVTASERKAIETLNANNGWGLPYNEFERLIQAHKLAKQYNNKHRMELVEYRFTDLNFHDECRMLQEGRYEELSEPGWDNL